MTRRRTLGGLAAVAAGAVLNAPADAGAHLHFGTNPIHLGAPPRAAAIGDFEGDGLPDVAVITPAGLVVVWGDRFGGAAPQGYAAGGEPTDLAVADLDRDGRDDVLMASARADGPEVWWGRPDRRFDAAVLPNGRATRSIAAADISGDGTLDAVAADGDAVLVYPGRGTRGFGAPATVGFGSAAHSSVTVADLDGNGRDDLLGVLEPGGSALAVRRAAADAPLAVPAVTTLPGCCARALAAARIDGDADADVALAYGPQGAVAVLLAGPGGRFGAPVPVPMAGVQHPPVVADLDGDGRADLAYGGEALTLLRGRGDGTFAPPVVLQPTRGVPLLAADLDSDGAAVDLLLADAAEGGALVVALNHGLGTLDVEALDFGKVEFRTRSAPQRVTLRNTAVGPLRVGPVTFRGDHKGDFRIAREDCSARMIPGEASCTIDVVARPRARSARTAFLRVINRSGEGALDVDLSVRGVDTTPPTIALDVPSQRLGAVARRGLVARVHAQERSRVELRATLRPAVARRLGAPQVVLDQTRRFHPRQERRLRLRLLPQAGLPLLRAERVRLRLHARATDPAHHVTRLGRTVWLRR